MIRTGLSDGATRTKRGPTGDWMTLNTAGRRIRTKPRTLMFCVLSGEGSTGRPVESSGQQCDQRGRLRRSCDVSGRRREHGRSDGAVQRAKGVVAAGRVDEDHRVAVQIAFRSSGGCCDNGQRKAVGLVRKIPDLEEIAL